jgi:beta-galactosidase
MFYFGVDYYPEQWPEERWPEDARLMAEAGINLVRLAEFAWSFLEPHPGRFDFDWLDRALDVLQAHGIRAVLGTPTASPPPWVMAMLPDAYRVLESGQRQTYGNRREYCPTHPGYLKRGCIVTQAMAEHYADHPAVMGWQIDNELGGCCYCSLCRVAFQVWLQNKYGSLGALNGAWGTAFWSHIYTEWSQIPVPLETGGVPNPGLDLDYRRFMSDAYVHFQQEQVDILRRVCPTHLITHNFMGFHYDQVNYFDLARTLDFVAWDNYPRTAWSRDEDVDPAAIALGHDTMRGLKGQNFWLMEQQAGSGGWQEVGLVPRPGEMRLWTYQAIAHGADAIVYFRWRTARFGTEQFWQGVLDHHGQPRRRYRELRSIGTQLKQVGEMLLGAESCSRVAMVLSYDSRFAFQGQPNHRAFQYSDLFHSYYAALHRHNIGVAIVPPTADLSEYRLVIAPALYVLDHEAAGNLRHYVQNGGTLLVTARSGVKDEANALTNTPLPGLLGDMCGIEVEEHDALSADTQVPLAWEETGLASGVPGGYAWLWCDILAPSTAQVVARYQAEFYTGRAAITLNQFGQGQAAYVGTLGDAALHGLVVDWLLRTASVSPALSAPGGVEVVERRKDEQRLLFLLNHTHQTHAIVLPRPMTDLLSGQLVSSQVTLEPKGLAILGYPTLDGRS